MLGREAEKVIVLRLKDELSEYGICWLDKDRKKEGFLLLDRLKRDEHLRNVCRTFTGFGLHLDVKKGFVVLKGKVEITLSYKSDRRNSTGCGGKEMIKFFG